jgi:hypothetical protein
MQVGKNGRDMASWTRASNETSESILNSLQHLDVRHQRAIQQWVANSLVSSRLLWLQQFWGLQSCQGFFMRLSARMWHAGLTTSCCLCAHELIQKHKYRRYWVELCQFHLHVCVLHWCRRRLFQISPCLKAAHLWWTIGKLHWNICPLLTVSSLRLTICRAMCHRHTVHVRHRMIWWCQRSAHCTA